MLDSTPLAQSETKCRTVDKIHPNAMFRINLDIRDPEIKISRNLQIARFSISKAMRIQIPRNFELIIMTSKRLEHSQYIDYI